MNSIEILDKILIKYKTLCSKFANASNFLSNTKGDSYYSIQKRNQKNPVQIRLSNHGTFLKTWIDREELSDSKTRLLDPSSCFNISIVFIDDNTNITTQCVGQNNCDNCTITPCQPQTFQGQNELGKPFTVKQYVYKSSSINSRNLNGIVKAIMEARFRGEYIDPLLTTAKRASQKELTSQPQQPIQENNKQINTNKNMKINESQLRKIIQESVKNVLVEGYLHNQNNQWYDETQPWQPSTEDEIRDEVLTQKKKRNDNYEIYRNSQDETFVFNMLRKIKNNLDKVYIDIKNGDMTLLGGLINLIEITYEETGDERYIICRNLMLKYIAENYNEHFFKKSKIGIDFIDTSKYKDYSPLSKDKTYSIDMEDGERSSRLATVKDRKKV